MEPSTYFLKVTNGAPIYKVEDIINKNAISPFLNFESRILSLQRNWELNLLHLKKHTEIIKKIPEEIIRKHREDEKQYYLEKASGMKHSDSVIEFYEWGWTDEELIFEYNNTIESDLDYFPEYLKGSAISFSISILENLLEGLSDRIAYDLKLDIKVSKKSPLPFINKYVHHFTSNYGLDIELSHEQQEALNAIREIRNRFIHNIDRDIPKKVQETINKMTENLNSDVFVIRDEFVVECIIEICKLVKDIELAYIKFYVNLTENK